MKTNSHLPSALRPACIKEPATRNAGDTANNPSHQASPPPDLRPANINPRCHFPSRLQKSFAKENKSGASTSLSSQPIFSSHHLQQKFTEIEEITTESLRKCLTQLNRETLLTFEFRTIMEENVNHGLEALDQEIAPFLENAADQKSRKALESSRSLAKARLQAAVEETSLAEGWKAFQPAKSKLEWESSDGPLLIKRGFSLQQVKLERENIASGAYGSVSIFENENGDKLIGKTSKNMMRNRDNSVRDDLADELKAFQTIYRAVGPHRNLVNAYGIAHVPKNDRKMKRGLLNACGLAQVQKNSKREPVLLMDIVPGPTGEKTFDALRKCWNAGKIFSREYWGAMQFIGRGLLDVTEHLGKAGVVHNDIKPENFLVNEETGEPVVIDLGIWSKPGERHGKGTLKFLAAEAILGPGVNERSDVFSVGASLQDGIEGDRVKKLRKDLRKLMDDHRRALSLHGAEGDRVKELEEEIRQLAAQHGIEGGETEEANLALDELIVKEVKEKLYKKAAFKNDEGNMVRTPGTYSAETAYTRFVNSILELDMGLRVNSEQAKKLDFLNDSMLDDDAAKKVIKKSIVLAREEEKKPEGERWKRAEPQIRLSEADAKRRTELIQALRNALFKKPNLFDYAALRHESKTDPELGKVLDGNEVRNLQGDIEQDAARYADLFIENAPWFDDFKKITETVKMRSGVDEGGARLNGTHLKPEQRKNIDKIYEDSVRLAQSMVGGYEKKNELETYANDAEQFLRAAGALKKIGDRKLIEKIAQVRERAAVARRMMEILNTDFSKLEKGNVGESESLLAEVLFNH